METDRRVEASGRLLADEMQAAMIAHVQQKLQAAHLTKAETHVADTYHRPLVDECIGRAFLVTLLPEIPGRRRALAELQRVLKPGAILCIHLQRSMQYLLKRVLLNAVASSFAMMRQHDGFQDAGRNPATNRRRLYSQKTSHLTYRQQGIRFLLSRISLLLVPSSGWRRTGHV